MAYNPNPSHKAVSKRTLQAVEYVCMMLPVGKSKPLSQKQIDKAFGKSNLSRWLRRKLLITDSDRYNYHTGECKQYSLNIPGVKEVCSMFEFIPTIKYHGIAGANKMIQRHIKKATKTGDFEYTLKNNRYFNECQFISNLFRGEVFAQNGFAHNYDMAVASLTLIVQIARQKGLTSPTPHIDYILSNKIAARTMLALQVGCTYEQAKKVITATVCGATLHPIFGSIVDELDNPAMLQKLIASVFYQNIRSDVKLMWDAIKLHDEDVLRTMRDNRNLILDKKSRHLLPAYVKWNTYYFPAEKQVMDIVKAYMNKNNNMMFREHDGFRCQYIIDTEELSSVINRKTGFTVVFEEE